MAAWYDTICGPVLGVYHRWPCIVVLLYSIYTWSKRLCTVYKQVCKTKQKNVSWQVGWQMYIFKYQLSQMSRLKTYFMIYYYEIFSRKNFRSNKKRLQVNILNFVLLLASSWKRVETLFYMSLIIQCM
jgi:hypothetical protein